MTNNTTRAREPGAILGTTRSAIQSEPDPDFDNVQPIRSTSTVAKERRATRNDVGKREAVIDLCRQLIPTTACRGRTGDTDGYEFSGYVDERGVMRFDCMNALSFHLTVDLAQVPLVKAQVPLVKAGRTFPIPTTACKGRTGDTDGNEFSGYVDKKRGVMRFDCANAPGFHLTVDLTQLASQDAY